jgi:hypothetical protein
MIFLHVLFQILFKISDYLVLLIVTLENRDSTSVSFLNYFVSLSSENLGNLGYEDLNFILVYFIYLFYRIRLISFFIYYIILPQICFIEFISY